MKSWSVIAVVAFMAMPAILEAQTSSAVGWKAYRNETGGYEVKYPDTLSLSTPSGKTCSNDECKAIEQVLLTGRDSSNGKAIVIGSMSFIIQKGINPQHLPIQQWYEALAHRPINPASETIVIVGGKTAIHRGPLTKAAIVHTVDGKTVSSSEGMVPENTVFVPLNETDVLTISSHSSGVALSETYAKVLSTLTFTK